MRARATDLKLLAVLDANVLYPFQLRNLLLWLAQEGLYEPLWSELILDEIQRNLRGKAELTEAQLDHLESQMRQVFPEACGSRFHARKEVPDLHGGRRSRAYLSCGVSRVGAAEARCTSLERDPLTPAALDRTRYGIYYIIVSGALERMRWPRSEINMWFPQGMAGQ